MKVAIFLNFDIDKRQLIREIEKDSCPHIIEWNYPVLPSTGDYICQPARFLSPKMTEDFKRLKVKDIFNLSDVPLDMMDMEAREENLYDFYNYANGDRFQVSSIEWLYDPDYGGDYPLINIDSPM
ncbi:hypothetical protein [Parabacteroides sp. PF5-9]|uniref:hypothetical protein n=1 Tax=Parabacteroides sp. PF5-9 TaxID=1742404 RepID=UPI002474F2A3|nr:hypothetical protein [Parabacteroides sp. PF5-9]MDH6358910.1 hypothetical protein [Parabacteroides sp. PF5-9]